MKDETERMINVGKTNKVMDYFEYLDANSTKSKEVLIEGIKKTFGLSANSAKQYYYKWKKQYMNSEKCIPKDEKAVKTVKAELRIDKQIVGSIDVKATPVDSKEPKIKPREEVEKDTSIKFESKQPKNNNLKLKTAIVTGKYGEYEVLEDGSVKAGDLTFKTAEDIEKYKHEEMALFMSRLGEILDVMIGNY